VFSLGSAAVAWSSKKQPTLALSSTKVEYRGAAVATWEAILLKQLLKDLHDEVSNPTIIYYDNLRSIQLAKNPVFHARTKHIEVHYHFVRERVLSGEVELQHGPTDWQTADIFTKPLGFDKLLQFSGALGLRHLDMPNLRGREEPKPTEHAEEGERAEDKLEIANSDKAHAKEGEKAEDELETANLDKAWSQEDRSRDPQEPQVELEGECSETSSTSAGSAEQAVDRIGLDRSVRSDQCV
jgi:hypothetical protein